MGKRGGVGAADEGGAWVASAARFQFDPDVKKASEVSLEFVQEGPESTRVEFEHRHLERHGEDWQKLRDSVGSEGGWNSVMGEFVKWANAKE